LLPVLWAKVRRHGLLVSDGLWLVGGQGGVAIGTLVGVRLLTEATPPAVFGSVSLLLGVLTLCRNFFNFPFCQASLRYYSEAAGRGEVGVLRRVVFGYIGRSNALLAALATVLGIGFIAGGRPADLMLIAILVVLLVVDNVRTAETDLLNAARRQRPFSILKVGEAWLKPLLALVSVALFGPSPIAVLLGYLVAAVLLYGSLFKLRSGRVGVGGPGRPEVAGAEAELRAKVWHFGLPLMPIAMLDWISQLSDRYLIGGLIGPAEAGIYIAAYGLMNQPFALAQLTMELVLRPHYFEAVASGDDRRAGVILRAWVASLAAVFAVGVVAIWFLSDPVAALCLGPRYRGAARLMPFIAAGSAMYFLSLTVEKVFYARQQTGRCLSIRVTGAVLSLAVGVPMILASGTLGAARAVPIYYGAQLAICLGVAGFGGRKEIPMPGPKPA
jgi:O-antigen/teichoic acid export membrane protein